MDDLKKKRFLLGLLLAWLPWLPGLVGLAHTFRYIVSGRATGFAVLSAGFAEMFASIGFLAALAFAFGSIVFLARSFEPGHWFRTSVAVASLGVSLLMVVLVVLFCWTIARRL